MGKDDDTKPALRVLGLVTFLALPLSVLCEGLIRRYMLPASFELVRAELESTLTFAAWLLAGLTALLSPLAWRLAWVARTKLKRAGNVVAFALGASLVQIPALLALITLFFGARFLPALLTILFSSAAVVALYAQAQKCSS